MTDPVDDEIADLIQRWIVRFCEMPILIDPVLMRAVLENAGEQGMR